MPPALYKKILKFVETNNLRTITVDIFDTILLNDYWPRKLCIYELAGQWIGDICRVTGLQVTNYELLSLHNQAERELRLAGQPLQIDTLFDAMLDLLCIKYGIEISDDDRLQLLATMIATEIQFKITNSRPNYGLIAILQSIKQVHPELKIYFVTDTALYGEQIKTMMQIFGIKIFDDGVSSSDLRYEKQNGELYEHLAEKLPADFEIMYNLHIGDHRIPDYLMPILHDSYAIHYRPVRMRGLRTLVGKTALQTIKAAALLREKRRFKQISSISTRSEWEQYGMLIGQIEEIWASQINVQAKLDNKTTFLLMNGLAGLRVSQGNVIQTMLDRDTIVQAYAWLLATFETSRWNADKLLQIVTEEAQISSRAELCRICFGEDYMASELALKSLSDDEFYQELLAEIRALEPEKATLLQKNYERILELLSQASKLCVAEKTDDGTTRLLREFARLHGAANKISEWILDTKGTITKVERQVLPQLNERRLKQVMRGKQNAAVVLRQTELSSAEYLQKILLLELKRIEKASI